MEKVCRDLESFEVDGRICESWHMVFPYCTCQLRKECPAGPAQSLHISVNPPNQSIILFFFFFLQALHEHNKIAPCGMITVFKKIELPQASV